MEKKPPSLSRNDKINIIQELLINHKAGMAIPEEYTIARYEFLISEGIISLTKEQKKAIFDKAKGEYAYELNNIIQDGSVVEGKTAQKAMHNLEDNMFNEQQLNYLYSKCKIIALKQFLDHADKIEFRQNG